MRQSNAGSSREQRKSVKAGPSCQDHRQRAFLSALIERIEVGADQIDIHPRPTLLGVILEVAATPLPRAPEDETQILCVPYICAARGERSRC
jgi:hypothetical protein